MCSATSSAARITATWPSIIPLGPTMSTPACAWASAISAYATSVRSLSTRPSGVSSPQWPWSVNSSRHRSLITVSASPTSATTSVMARLRMPAGSIAPEPVASRCSGIPNSITPPSPSSAASLTAASSEERVCWTTPGIEEIGCGSVRPSRTKTGSTSCRASSDVSATIRRSAGVVRSRRGRTDGPVISRGVISSFTSVRGRRGRPAPTSSQMRSSGQRDVRRPTTIVRAVTRTTTTTTITTTVTASGPCGGPTACAPRAG